MCECCGQRGALGSPCCRRQHKRCSIPDKPLAFEKQVAIVLSGSDCVAVVLRGGGPALQKLVTGWRRCIPTPDTRVYLIVQGSERAIAQHMRTHKRQLAAGAGGGSSSGSPDVVTPASLQAALTWVYLRSGVEPKVTSNIEHTCRHLVNLTRGIAEAPYRYVAVRVWRNSWC